MSNTEQTFLRSMQRWNLEGDDKSYPCVTMGDINRLLEIIRRKDKLLEEALDQLMMVEWEINLGTIVKLEEELGHRSN